MSNYFFICDQERQGGVPQLQKNGPFLSIFGHCSSFPQGCGQVKLRFTQNLQDLGIANRSAQT